jgi:hypothetical protein
MKVYVEANFVLEAVFEQEEHRACAELMKLAASKSISLACKPAPPRYCTTRRDAGCALIWRSTSASTASIAITRSSPNRAAIELRSTR